MVEKSTYTSANSVILKSLMPFHIKRLSEIREDINGVDYNLPYYCIELFRKDVPVMLLYATKGLDFAMQYSLDYVYSIINLVKEPDHNDEDNIYFPISSKLFLKVNKDMFNKFIYVQSVVGGILKISTNRLTMNKINDCEMWIKKLSNNNYEKGKSLLDATSRLIDETTKKILKVNEYNKQDVFAVIRWMTEDYNDLRIKDNMNLKNKRLRCNEYIASLLTQEFSNRLNRIISLGTKATIENYSELFKFPGDILIQRMHATGILRFDDNVNDLDFFSKFKYTELYWCIKTSLIAGITC